MLYQAFFDQDADTVSAQISAYAKHSISYLDFRDDFHHALTIRMFMNFSGSALSNRESGEGRPDLVEISNTDPTVLIIEIKTVRKEEELEKALDDAIAQLTDRKYAEPYLLDGYKIITCSLAYCRKDCRARFA